MFDDATALLIFRVAVGAAATGASVEDALAERSRDRR
jgi:hypothetical protein